MHLLLLTNKLEVFSSLEATADITCWEVKAETGLLEDRRPTTCSAEVAMIFSQAMEVTISIYGQTGFDTAVYLGRSDHYVWKPLGGGVITVEVKPEFISINNLTHFLGDGKDTLYEVERLRFSDGEINVGGGCHR